VQSSEKGLCIPGDYQKYDLPSLNETTFVTIGVHLKDIPKVRYSRLTILIPHKYIMLPW
jgi:hypothetical protein